LVVFWFFRKLYLKAINLETFGALKEKFFKFLRFGSKFFKLKCIIMKLPENIPNFGFIF